MFGSKKVKATTTWNHKSNTNEAFELLMKAREFPADSVERGNLLTEALVVLTLNVNYSTRTGMWGSLSAGLK